MLHRLGYVPVANNERGSKRDFGFLIFLSVLQGVTELFPVSSFGHTLLVPGLIGMHIAH
ncbi:MAG: Undecaprenyl-diphosphatase (EC [uncultured Caballeronia sp.]|nr:MAG: Undecaprenyl-diphosphatase (EC [uncultured Caballeronia sp.]